MRLARYAGCTEAGEVCEVNAEVINHPLHYGGDTTYEAIKVIEAWDLDFLLGNTVKYISRAGKKGSRLEDLRKAEWYLKRAIANQIALCGHEKTKPETGYDCLKCGVWTDAT